MLCCGPLCPSLSSAQIVHVRTQSSLIGNDLRHRCKPISYFFGKKTKDSDHVHCQTAWEIWTGEH